MSTRNPDRDVLTPATLLLVDEGGVSRGLLGATLREAGFCVLEAAGGAEALALAAQRPDLIILDVTLPGMDGFDLCRWLKASALTSSIPVLHVSAVRLDSMSRARALDSGADGYLTLPVQREELLATVRALLRIHKAEAQFRAVFEQALDAIVIADDEGRYVEVNEAACRLFGLARNELLGRCIEDFMPRGFDFESAWAEFQAGGRQTGAVTLVRLDGTTRDVEFAASANIVPGRHLSVLRDITERKRAEETLRLQAQIMDLIHDAVILTDADGYVKAWNGGATRLYGYGAGEALGRHVRFLYRDDVPGQSYDVMIAALKASGTHDAEFIAQRKGGEDVFVHLGLSLVRAADGTVIGMVGYSMDITERKRAEEALRDSEKRALVLAARLQAAQEEERRRIALEVHDELGQALTGLKLDVSWLGRRVPDTDRDARHRVRRTLTLIDETIAMVRRIASELRPGLLDVLGLEAAIEWQVAQFRERTGIACELTTTLGARPLGPDLSVAVFRVCQEALTNIVRHAEATAVRVTLTTDTAALLLIIEDDGKGIEADNLGAPSLGLLGMRERVRFFGGTLHVTGGPGQGTVLGMRIPLPAGEPSP